MNEPVIVVTEIDELSSLSDSNAIIVIDGLDHFHDNAMLRAFSRSELFVLGDEIRSSIPERYLDRPAKDWKNGDRKRMKPRRR